MFICVILYNIKNFLQGTGALEDCGKGNGKYYTINVPLKSGLDDDMFYELFSKYCLSFNFKLNYFSIE